MRNLSYINWALKALISAQLGILYVVVVGTVYHFGLM